MKNFIAKSSLIFMLPVASWAWGGRGHHAICEAATFLTKEKGLHDYIQAKGHIMGYLCNIPDTYWRSLEGEATNFGAPTHYMDVEILGIAVKDIPLDYRKVISDFQGKANAFHSGKKIMSIANELGSNWWRADQFYRRALAEAAKIKTLTQEISSAKEKENPSAVLNNSLDNLVVNIGLMGHFVGDNGQAFHSTSDYDGYGAGHGGIHAYYEENLVAYLPDTLVPQIVAEGERMQKGKTSAAFLNHESVLENMRELSAISLKDIDQILKLDKLLKPSTTKDEKGMQIKTPAEREPASKVYKSFQPILITEMARSASLLAKIWDQIYIEAGRPQLSVFKSYNFPHKPDFVMPDYLKETGTK